MHRRFAVVLLAAMAVAAVFVLPAHASAKSTHRALRSGVPARTAAHGLLPHKADGSQVVSWAVGAPMPVPVAETGGGAGIGGRFVVAGGYNAGGTVVNNTQIYNKTTNTWTAGAPIPGAGGGWADAAFCVDPATKLIHVVNGVDGAFLYAAHQVYNPATNTWTFASAPVLSSGDTWYGQDQGCAFLGGKLYLFGGYGIVSPTQPSAQLESLTWVYDPATDTWADTGKLMKAPGGFLWSGYTNTPAQAFVAGGYDLSFAPQAATQTYTVAGGWTACPALPTAVGGPGEGNVMGHLVVWGGFASTGASNKSYGSVTTGCGAWVSLAANFNLPAAKGFLSWGSGASLYSAGGYDNAFAVLPSSEHLP
jgi:hypothetical protein